MFVGIERIDVNMKPAFAMDWARVQRASSPLLHGKTSSGTPCRNNDVNARNTHSSVPSAAWKLTYPDKQPSTGKPPPLAFRCRLAAGGRQSQRDLTPTRQFSSRTSCARGFVHSSETSWKDNTTNQTTSLYGGGLAQTRRAILHCRAGHRGFEVDDRRTQAFRPPRVGVPHCVKMKHCKIEFPHDLCEARPHTELPPLGRQ